MSALDPDALSRFYRDEVLPRLSVEDVFGDGPWYGKGKWIHARCPIHHGGDLNFAVNVDNLKWRCQSQCQLGGDPVAFLQKTEGLGFREAVDKLARRVGLDAGSITGERSTTRTASTSRPKPKRAKPPTKPEPETRELDGLAKFWDACVRADELPQVRDYLRDERGLDPTAVADLDLGRAVPDGISASFPWAGSDAHGPWKSYASMGLRLAVPTYDAQGVFRSMVFRRCRAGKGAKSLAAKGGQREGVAMMCPLARQLFGRGDPKFLAERESLVGSKCTIVIAEGEPDFLTFATHFSEADERVPATIGGFSGAWSVLARAPVGSHLRVQVHDDDSGLSYANEIVHAVLKRWRAGELSVELPNYFALVGAEVVRKGAA